MKSNSDYLISYFIEKLFFANYQKLCNLRGKNCVNCEIIIETMKLKKREGKIKQADRHTIDTFIYILKGEKYRSLIFNFSISLLILLFEGIHLKR